MQMVHQLLQVRIMTHNENTYHIASLDISSVTGSHYLYIEFGYDTYNGAGCYGYVNKLYLTTT